MGDGVHVSSHMSTLGQISAVLEGIRDLEETIRDGFTVKLVLTAARQAQVEVRRLTEADRLVPLALLHDTVRLL